MIELEARTIQDYPASAQPVWQLVATEALALGAAALLFPFGLGRSRRRTPRRAEQRTVGSCTATRPTLHATRWRPTRACAA
jgi:hypothetical protein